MTLSVERVRHRAPIVEAVFFSGNAEEVAEWCGGQALSEEQVAWEEGARRVDEGQWLIKGTRGDFIAIDAAEFEREYDSPPEEETAETSGLVAHAEKELDLLGVGDSDIDQLSRQAVMDLIRLFASQGHSGSSAAWVLQVVARLMAYAPLSDLTDDPEEWMVISEAVPEDGGHPLIWQSRRNPEAFSETAGRTYYLLSERASVEPGMPTPLHKSKEHAGADSQG